jgi:hypothetical protein
MFRKFTLSKLTILLLEKFTIKNFWKVNAFDSELTFNEYPVPVTI